jgi:dihydroorotate dehydrogenase
MHMYAHVIRPILFRFDPEWVHDRAIQAAGLIGSLKPLPAMLARHYNVRDPVLESTVGGLRFSNPIGLAAGFDKSGRAVRALSGLGFGHLEIGSVSAEPSAGNPRPRLWRLPQDRAILVHYGLPNDGADVVARRLTGLTLRVPLGINIVKTNRGIDAPPDSEDDIIEDYVRSVRLFKDRADYLHLNLSCPNTGDGRDFFAERGHLPRLLRELAGLDIRCPVFLKASPTGGPAYIDQMLIAAESAPFITGFAFNLAPGRPDGLRTPPSSIAHLPGAVSGRPIEAQMNAAIGDLYRRMDRKRYRIIGVGGVFSAEDAYRKVRLGASLVQLMTALIYQGPGVVRRINRGLCRLLRRDGFRRVADAVGTAHPI